MFNSDSSLGLVNPIFSLNLSLGARWLLPCSYVGYPSDMLICGPIISLLSLEALLDLLVCVFFFLDLRKWNWSAC